MILLSSALANHLCIIHYNLKYWFDYVRLTPFRIRFFRYSLNITLDYEIHFYVIW